MCDLCACVRLCVPVCTCTHVRNDKIVATKLVFDVPGNFSSVLTKYWKKRNYRYYSFFRFGWQD